jgi:hypothetical protein
MHWLLRRGAELQNGSVDSSRDLWVLTSHHAGRGQVTLLVITGRYTMASISPSSNSLLHF